MSRQPPVACASRPSWMGPPGELPVCDVILNADDFGRSAEINQAILRAHRRGMLTSASLMVTGDAAQEAVDLARQMPELAVGLHLVLVDGRPALPPGDVPRLVEADGRFAADPLRAALRYLLLDRSGRDELKREIAAQFQRFAASGLPLAHVDGHCLLHVHPAVFRYVAPLAREFGARGFRLPRDDFSAAWRHPPRRGWWQQAGWAVPLALLAACEAPTLRKLGLMTPRACYGLLASGHMRAAYVVDVLSRLTAGPVEIYFHPTLGRRLDPLGPNRRDFATLMSRCVRRAARRPGLRLTNYLRLAAEQQQQQP